MAYLKNIFNNENILNKTVSVVINIFNEGNVKRGLSNCVICSQVSSGSDAELEPGKFDRNVS